MKYNYNFNVFTCVINIALVILLGGEGVGSGRVGVVGTVGVGVVGSGGRGGGVWGRGRGGGYGEGSGGEGSGGGEVMLIDSSNSRTRRIQGGDRNFSCPSKVISWLKQLCWWILNNRIAFITDTLYGPGSMVRVLPGISHTWLSDLLIIYHQWKAGLFYNKNVCIVIVL